MLRVIVLLKNPVRGESTLSKWQHDFLKNLPILDLIHYTGNLMQRTDIMPRNRTPHHRITATVLSHSNSVLQIVASVWQLMHITITVTIAEIKLALITPEHPKIQSITLFVFGIGFQYLLPIVYHPVQMLFCKLELGDLVLNEMNGFLAGFCPLRFFSARRRCTVLALTPGYR